MKIKHTPEGNMIEVLKSRHLSFQVLPPVVLYHSCENGVSGDGSEECALIPTNRNPWLQCKRDLVQSLVGNYQRKCLATSTSGRYKLFNLAGCICRGKPPGKRPLTEAKVKFERICFAVQEFKNE